jgi:FlaA1/EpsC-like NDP-sugar epimerase
MITQQGRRMLGRAMRQPIPRALLPALTPVRIALDVVAWAVAIPVAARVHYSMIGSGFQTAAVARAVVLASTGQLIYGSMTGLYRNRRRYGSFDEVALLLIVTGLAAVLGSAVDHFFAVHLPAAAFAVGALLAIVVMMGTRYVWRSIAAIRRRPEPDAAIRLLIFGAGDRGCGIVDELLDAKGTPYLPVGMIDDDPAKRRFKVRGIPVLGALPHISRIAREHEATALLVAVTDVSPKLMHNLLEQAEQCEPPLQVKVLSPLSSLLGERPQTSDIKDLSEEDLLGRRKIVTDLSGIAGYITGKRVLVTGAGGSIGSELCRQLHKFSPERLVMLDRDESALHSVQLSIEGRALLDTPDLVLADLRDANRIFDVFEDIRPHVVFHAAALKHLTLLEANPAEAIKSNIWGTQTVLDAAQAVGVETFVNISTDKAASPACVLGYSKRIAERLTAYAASTAPVGTYVSVRFGNVLGSRGSVLSTFRNQIANGEALTVTDPNVTRFFMLIEEAVQLVIQAGAIGQPGEVLVLDMGEPVRIADVAQTLIRRSGRKLDIVYTGLRPGEKLHEDLLGADERDARPSHPLITQAHVPPLAPTSGAALSVEMDRELLTKELAGLCLAPSLAAVLSTGEIDSSGSARFVARANARALRARPAGISLADDDALALPADS